MKLQVTIELLTFCSHVFNSVFLVRKRVYLLTAMVSESPLCDVALLADSTKCPCKYIDPFFKSWSYFRVYTHSFDMN